MRVRTGTSGFSYQEWKGVFYPPKLPDKEMLPHYAARLDTVELNNTFYRLPKAPMIESWRTRVGDDFRFAVKASQRITHMARLAADKVAVPLADLWKTIGALEGRRGPLLFQLPPNLKRDDGRLAEFLALLPRGSQPVMEFRHPSWHDAAVHQLLRDAGVALCIADGVGDSEDGESGSGSGPEEGQLVQTASLGYVRLRREKYGDAALKQWVERLLAQGGSELYIYFKHEVTGPKLARRFAALAKERGATVGAVHAPEARPRRKR
jgi:uncharacterized protein YecE (DUF72 family)